MIFDISSILNSIEAPVGNPACRFQQWWKLYMHLFNIDDKEAVSECYLPKIDEVKMIMEVTLSCNNI